MRWESSTRVLILLAPIIRWIRKMLHNYYDCPIAVFKSKVDICNWEMECTISLLSLSFTFRFKCFFSLADDFRRQLKKAAWWDNSRAGNFGWRWKEKYQFYTWLLCLAPPIFAICICWARAEQFDGGKVKSRDENQNTNRAILWMHFAIQRWILVNWIILLVELSGYVRSRLDSLSSGIAQLQRMASCVPIQSVVFYPDSGTSSKTTTKNRAIL